VPRTKPVSWPPRGGPYRDDRLAFLAAAPELRRRARHGGFAGRVINALSLGLLTNELPHPDAMGSYRARRRMARLTTACADAAGKFDALDRDRLRRTGQLPSWFFAEVERLSRRR
jgi:hypothetical protein